MKLLILTQKIDEKDPVLGFFCRWVKECARRCETVKVVCLEKGEYTLPENVEVFSLGKESRQSRVRYIFNFFKYIFLLRDTYDMVFVHMNYEYVLLGGIWWRLMSKKIGMWYAHGATPLGLKTAMWFTDKIFTSTEEGFRLESQKKIVVGQGIDTDVFKPGSKISKDTFTIITVGRISRVKDYELLIEVARMLNHPFVVKIIGGPITSADREYEILLRGKVSAYHLEDKIFFVGPMTQKEIIPELQQADLFVNMSRTGSLDKAMLEAISVGVPVVSSNEAVQSILGEEASQLSFKMGDANDFKEKIEKLIQLSPAERQDIGGRLREVVVKGHTVSRLIEKILSEYKNL